jgi:hypothetical protein
VNPDTCRAQAESNVVFGLGAVLYQENNVRDGRIAESNFHDFPLPTIAEMPKVETVLVPTGGFWGGHGEPAILPLAPAVCNAVFRATGKRVRSLPLKHHDLRTSTVSLDGRGVENLFDPGATSSAVSSETLLSVRPGLSLGMEVPHDNRGSRPRKCLESPLAETPATFASSSSLT